MKWIKPSFLWMMYRAGWGFKDAAQARILAIEISHEGFEWALKHSCPSHPAATMSADEWTKFKSSVPVRVQWDPERDIFHAPLDHRSIQIGLSRPAVDLYVDEWIKKITDVTEYSQSIKAMIDLGEIDRAKSLLPVEQTYSRIDPREIGSAFTNSAPRGNKTIAFLTRSNLLSVCRLFFQHIPSRLRTPFDLEEKFPPDLIRPNANQTEYRELIFQPFHFEPA